MNSSSGIFVLIFVDDFKELEDATGLATVT